MKLLIVDDHPGLRSVLRQLIARTGDTVIECGSGEEAIAILRNFEPDFTTIDFRLGGMSGVALARSICAKRPESRCALVSSYEADELRLVAKEAGAIAYIQKDHLVELSKLVGELRRELGAIPA